MALHSTRLVQSMSVSKPQSMTENRSSAGALLCVLAAALFGALTAVAGGVVAALILLVLVACGLTLANYRVGLWLLLFLLPISATAIFPRELLGITGANPFNALLALTLLSFFVERVRHHKPVWTLALPRASWAFFVPVVIAGLVGMTHYGDIPGFVFARNLVSFASPTGYLRDVLIKPLIVVLLALLLGTAVRDGMKLQTVVVGLCLSIWLIAAWVFYFVLSSGVSLGQLASSTNREFLSGAGMHANDLGTLAASVLILMIFAIAGKDNSAWMRWLFVVTAGIAGALLVMSFSRGAFLGFAVALTVFFIVQRRLKTVIAGLFVLLLMLPLLPAELYERLLTGVGTGGSQVLHSQQDPLTAGRVAGVWIPLLAEVQSHPYFGNGLLAVAWSVPLRSGAMGLATLNPHNLYLKLLLEVGVIGFVLVALFFVHLWRRFRATAKNPAVPAQDAWLFAGASAVLLGYATSGLSGGDYLPDPSNFLLWIIWGLMLAMPAVEQPRATRLAH